MATHDRASDAFDPEVWLSADRIAALSGGRAKPTTVRSWWAAGILDFRVFPELGAKSNKRSHRSDVERFLRIKYGDFFPEPQPHPGHDPQPQESRLRDLIDTLTSVKAAAESAMQALVAEAEHHAASRRPNRLAELPHASGQESGAALEPQPGGITAPKARQELP